MTTVHRAKWVIIDSRRIIENGYIAVRQGRIVAFGRWRPGLTQAFDHGSGAIFPALTNAHTHLELSALAGCVPMGRGFLTWVRELVRQRDLTEPETLMAGAAAAIELLKASGCGLVGDIATLGLSLEPLAQAAGSGFELQSVWFREYLRDIPSELIRLDKSPAGVICSLAGHAPHTTSPAMLTAAKALTRTARLPFSIHLGESDLESCFIRTGKGQWAEYLQTRGIDPAAWGLPAPSPVVYADRLGLLDHKTIAVHLLDLDAQDIDILSDRKVKICLCPRSNQNLHGRLPDLPTLIARGLKPCLGTDSLASVDSLSVLDEAAFVATRFPGISPRTLLEMLTLNGAAALSLENRLGTLDIGKDACFVYASAAADTVNALLEALTQQPAIPISVFSEKSAVLKESL